MECLTYIPHRQLYVKLQGAAGPRFDLMLAWMEKERERERALELELELELGSFCAHLDAEIRS